MQRLFVFFALLTIAGLTGCQTCDDCTDYSSPVSASTQTGGCQSPGCLVDGKDGASSSNVNVASAEEVVR